ncbi:hypothetical protein [Woodsholea maritima]|uniref:hypothetical protein n=1 Tax=Woodsholea maritima TaxID=240237 RepID=UPI0003637BAC|nr:hypothetical protein [Woodsholea maritima]
MRYYTLAASALITTIGIGIGVANLTIGLVDQAIAFSWPVLSLGVIMAMITPELKRTKYQEMDLE